MSFSTQIATTITAGLSFPHQHSCAFEPDSGNIWIAYVERDAAEVLHRRFFRCTNDNEFTEMADWIISETDGYDTVDGGDGFALPSLSFVIDPAGHYLYAVTDAKFSVGSEIYLDYLVYSRLNLQDIASGFEEPTQLDYLHNTVTMRIFNNYDIILDHRPSGSERPMVAATKYNTGLAVHRGRFYWYGGTNNELVQTWVEGSNGYLDNDFALVDDRVGDAWYLHGSLDDTSYAYKGSFQWGNGAPFVWIEEYFDGIEVNLPGADMALGEGMVGLLAYDDANLKFATFDGATVSDIEEVTGASVGINNGAWSICYRYGYWHVLYGSDDDLKYKLRSPQGSWSVGGGTISCGSGEWYYIGITNSPNVNPRDEYEFGCVMLSNAFTDSPVWYQHIDDWYSAIVLPTDNYWAYGALLGSELFGCDVETDAMTSLAGNSRYRIMATEELDGRALFTDQSEIMELGDTFTEYLTSLEQPGYTNRVFEIELPPRRRLGNSWKLCNQVEISYEMSNPAYQTAYLYVVNENGEQVTITLDGTNSGKSIDIILYGREFFAKVVDSTEYGIRVDYIRIDGNYDGNRV